MKIGVDIDSVVCESMPVILAEVERVPPMVLTEVLARKMPRCRKCGFEFSFHQINKAKSAGRIRCPVCHMTYELKEILPRAPS